MSKCQIVVSQSEHLPNCSSSGLFAMCKDPSKGFKEKTELTEVKVHWCTKGRWFSQPEEITRFKLLKNCFTSHKWLSYSWRQDALWEGSKCFVQRSAVKLGSCCFDRCHLPKHRCRPLTPSHGSATGCVSRRFHSVPCRHAKKGFAVVHGVRCRFFQDPKAVKTRW